MLNKSDKFKPFGYSTSCRFYLGAIITTLLCQVFAGIVSVLMMKSDPDISTNGDFNSAFMIIVQAVNGAFIVLFCKIAKKRPDFTYFKDSETGRRISAADIVVPIFAAAFLLAAMYLPTVWYGFFTRVIGIPPEAGQINVDTVSSVVMLVIASVILAPICEESIYRGVLLHGLKSEKSVVYAVFMSALSFMLMHMNPLQVVFQFSLGVVAAFIAVKSRKLLPSILLHATANALALIVDMTAFGGVLGSCVMWLTDHVSAAFFITLALFVGGGAALFALIKYGFNIPDIVARAIRRGKNSNSPETESYGSAAQISVHDGDKAMEISNAAADADLSESERAAQELAKRAEDANKRDGFIKYWIAAGICIVMLVINTVSLAVS